MTSRKQDLSVINYIHSAFTIFTEPLSCVVFRDTGCSLYTATILSIDMLSSTVKNGITVHCSLTTFVNDNQFLSCTNLNTQTWCSQDDTKYFTTCRVLAPNAGHRISLARLLSSSVVTLHVRGQEVTIYFDLSSMIWKAIELLIVVKKKVMNEVLNMPKALRTFPNTFSITEVPHNLFLNPTLNASINPLFQWEFKNFMCLCKCLLAIQFISEQAFFRYFVTILSPIGQFIYYCIIFVRTLGRDVDIVREYLYDPSFLTKLEWNFACICQHEFL